MILWTAFTFAYLVAMFYVLFADAQPLVGYSLLGRTPDIKWVYKTERVKASEVCYIKGNPTPKEICEVRERGGISWGGPYETEKDCERNREYIKDVKELKTYKCVPLNGP